jgi:hypothetical protein
MCVLMDIEIVHVSIEGARMGVEGLCLDEFEDVEGCEC